MRLVPIWKRAWRLSSLQIAMLTAALNAVAAAWVYFDGHIPPLLWATVNMILGVATGVARVIPQPSVTGADDQDPQ